VPVALLLGFALLLAPQRPSTGPAGLEGRVVDDVKAPVDGARVFATSVESGPRVEVVTDRNGRFRFSNLPVGRYRVHAEKLGYVVNLLNAGVVTTLTEPVGGLELTLYKAGIIAGQVVDERGNPLPRTVIQALRKVSTTGSTGSQGPPPMTDDRGEFRVPVMAGEYVVMAQPRGRTPGNSREEVLLPTYYPSTTNQTSASPVTVRAGQTTAGVYIVVQSGQAYRVSGVVVDEQGRPQRGAFVTLVRQIIAGQMSMQAATTGTNARADGSFVIEGVPPGRYQLTSVTTPVTPVQGDSITTRAMAGFTAALSGKSQATVVEVVDSDVKDVRVLAATSP
jgi:hypothetical protein